MRLGGFFFCEKNVNFEKNEKKIKSKRKKSSCFFFGVLKDNIII